MAANTGRTNWVYAAIGGALVLAIAGGFIWLEYRAEQWEQTLTLLVSKDQPAAREGTPATNANGDASLEWAAAIVEVVDEAMQAADERARQRNQDMIDALLLSLDERLDEIRQSPTVDMPSQEEFTSSILEQVIDIVDDRIERQSRAQEHHQAKVTMARTLIRTGLGGALDAYRSDMGHYPTPDEGGLWALIQAPEDEDQAGYWPGPFLDDPTDLLDPWGNELLYEATSPDNPDGYELASAGPDGEFGTADDISTGVATRESPRSSRWAEDSSHW